MPDHAFDSWSSSIDLFNDSGASASLRFVPFLWCGWKKRCLFVYFLMDLRPHSLNTAREFFQHSITEWNKLKIITERCLSDDICCEHKQTYIKTVVSCRVAVSFFQFILFFYLGERWGGGAGVGVKLEGDTPAVRDQFQDCKHGKDTPLLTPPPLHNSEKCLFWNGWAHGCVCPPPRQPPHLPTTPNIPAPPPPPPAPPFPLRVSCWAG